MFEVRRYIDNKKKNIISEICLIFSQSLFFLYIGMPSAKYAKIYRILVTANVNHPSEAFNIILIDNQ